jgi:hypothetical protein
VITTDTLAETAMQTLYPFFIFQQHFFQEHLSGSWQEATGPGSSSKDAATAWRALSDSEQKLFVQKAAQNRKAILAIDPGWKLKQVSRKKGSSMKKHKPNMGPPRSLSHL